MNHDPNTDPNTPYEGQPELDANDPEATAIAEAAAEDAAAREAAAAADGKATGDAPVDTPAGKEEPATPSPADSAADKLAAAADRMSQAADAMAARSAQPTEPAAPAEEAPAPRDFDAELKALKQKYEDGDIEDQEEYEAQRDAIRDERTAARVLADVQKQQEAAAAQAAKEAADAADAAWAEDTKAFFADPGNAALIDDEVKQAAFNAAVAVEYRNAKGQIDNQTLLAKARERITGVAPTAQENADKIRKETFEREKNAREAPATTLRDAPAAGGEGEQAGTALDNLPTSELEDALMGMTPEARDRFLENAPGGLRDNPRATS